MLKASLLSVVLTLGVVTPSLAETPAELAQRQHQEGIALARRGQLDQAIAALEAARQILPNDPLILNTLGGLLTRKGDGGGAEQHLRRALEIDPSLDPARKSLAIVYFLNGRYGEATPHLKKLAEADPTRTLGRLLLGIIAAEEGRYEEAVGLLERAASLAHQQPRAILLLARSYSETQQPDKIPPLLDRLEELPTLTPEEHVAAAELYSDLDRNDAALTHLDAAARGPRKPVGIDDQRAVVLWRLARNTEAIRILEKSTENTPNGWSLSLLARIAREEGEPERAGAALRKAIDVEPDTEDHYLDLSLLYLEQGNNDRAEGIVGAGLGRMPDSYQLLVRKGAILEGASNKEGAIEAFRKAMSIEKDHQLALAGLASTLTNGGEFERALEILRTGTERFPDDYYLHYLRGYALHASLPSAEDKVAVSRQARDALERSVELNPNHADSHHWLGKIYADTDPEKAIRNFETALRLDPSQGRSKYLLARLYLKLGKRAEGHRLMADVRQAKRNSSQEDRETRLRVTLHPAK